MLVRRTFLRTADNAFRLDLLAYVSCSRELTGSLQKPTRFKLAPDMLARRQADKIVKVRRTE